MQVTTYTYGMPAWVDIAHQASRFTCWMKSYYTQLWSSINDVFMRNVSKIQGPVEVYNQKIVAGEKRLAELREQERLHTGYIRGRIELQDDIYDLSKELLELIAKRDKLLDDKDLVSLQAQSLQKVNQESGQKIDKFLKNASPAGLKLRDQVSDSWRVMVGTV